ncbi:MAG TPA: helix-turn-helix domain-containing protein, partial [Spirochaetia bacterium]|nr:helix-turn-helix domain-containing protein [Spirochaetia bacterium]
YFWPGNIRQLRNVITNAVILSEGEEIAGLELGDSAPLEDEVPIDGDLHAMMTRYSSDMEKRIIRTALQRSNGNITKSASALGISRKTLYEKMRRYGL